MFLVSKVLRPFSKAPRFADLIPLVSMSFQCFSVGSRVLALATLMQDKVCQDLPPIKDGIVTHLLVETLARETDWPTALVLSEDLPTEEAVSLVFRFHTIGLNYVQGCPYELIDKVYYNKVFASINRNFGSWKSKEATGIVWSKVALNGLIETLVTQPDL